MLTIHRWRIALVCAICVLYSQAACAQIPTEDGKAPIAGQSAAESSENNEPNQDEAKDVLELNSARDTFAEFRQAVESRNWSKAAQCIDFSNLPAGTTQNQKETLAERLSEILARFPEHELDEIPGDAEGDAYGFPPNQAIVVAPSSDGSWKFTAETAARIDNLFKEVTVLPRAASGYILEQWFYRLSPEMTKTVFLLKNYQWVCLFALIFLGILADALTRILLRYLYALWFKFRGAETRKEEKRKLFKPIGLLVQALVWYGGTLAIGLPDGIQAVLLIGLKFFAVVSAVWTAFLFVDLLAAYLVQKALQSDTKFDDLLVPLITKSLKVFAVCVGALMCAEAFNLPITGLLGGLGIGGAAIAFASKDAIANFFGSVTVLTDRPFEIGDWIVTDGVEGTVETVGFRSTRVRTFYNSLITLPNSLLTTAVVDNMGQRRYRRIKAMLGVQYDTTPEQLDAFCEGVRELIRRHPYTRKDYFHVYFNDFSDSSLNILLYCFLEVPDWSVELREKHRLFVDILKLAQRLGVSFAFPTRTLHMFQEQSNSSPSAANLSDSAATGQKLAAEIAGPLAPPDARPGPVTFGGPTPFDAHGEGE